MKKFKNEDKVFVGIMGILGFLSIIIKKLYTIKGFVSFISGICVFNCMVKLFKIITDDDKFNDVVYKIYGNDEKKREEKKDNEEKIFGFDMRAK